MQLGAQAGFTSVAVGGCVVLAAVVATIGPDPGQSSQTTVHETERALPVAATPASHYPDPGRCR